MTSTNDYNPDMDLVEVGDIFVSNWGYEQTNIDYYKVTRKMKKAIKIVSIESRVVEHRVQTSLVVPVPENEVGEEMTKFPKEVNGRAVLRIDSIRTAFPWDGSPEEQTNLGWGH